MWANLSCVDILHSSAPSMARLVDGGISVYVDSDVLAYSVDAKEVKYVV